MPNWKKVIVSGSDAVLNSVNATTALTASGLNYPTVDGTANQVIQTDGLGNLSFGSVDTTYESVKNVSGTTLYKGTPVHATASNALGNVVGIIAASASNPATMPATFILNETLADEAEGYAIINGLIQGVDTSAFEEGDVVYVGESSGYTNIKPTGSNLIQNLGIVTKIHPSNGAGIVLGAGRSNDVPNLLNGEVFWGEGNRAIKKPLAHILSGSSYTYSGSFSGSFQGDGSGLTGVSVDITSITGSQFFTYPFSSTGSITLTHNLNSQYPLVQVYDVNDTQIIPQSIESISVNSTKISFGSLESGTVIISKGGDVIGTYSPTISTYGDSDVLDYINTLSVVSSSAQISITESQISDLTHYTNSDTLSYINSLSVVSGSGVARTNINNTFTGTQTFDGISVTGTGSFAYIQSITGSAKIVGDAYIILNANTPTERYSGIKVYDSGSLNETGSLEYDSVNNHWFYESTNEGYSSGLLAGPQATRGAITWPTSNYIVKGLGSNHVGDSIIYESGSNIGIGTTSPAYTLDVSGSVNKKVNYIKLTKTTDPQLTQGTAVNLTWETQQVYDTDTFTHTAGGNTVTVDKDGVYMIIATVNAYSTGTLRSELVGRIVTSAGTEEGSTSVMYIRNTTGTEEGSMHMQTMVSLSAGQVIYVNVNPFYIDAGASTYIDGDRCELLIYRMGY